jgi:hypothetical protein
VPWEAEGVFDGISQYKLDHTGRILEHSVDNVVLRDPPMQGVSPLLAGFNLIPAQQPYPGVGAFCQAAAAAEQPAQPPRMPTRRTPTQQQQQQQQQASAAGRLAPAPGGASSGGWSSSPGAQALWLRFSWVRMYLALLATMQIMSASSLLEPALEV